MAEIKKPKPKVKDEEAETKCKCGPDCKCTPEHHCGCGGHEQEKVNYLEVAQRVQAEFENYKKRNKDIIKESFQNGIAIAVEKMLPALDSFKQAKAKTEDKSVLEGIDLIYGQILTALTDMGVKKIECIGKKFDPNFHNAVLVGKEDKKEDNVVLEEYQEGFMLDNRVIRHSVVKINKL